MIKDRYELCKRFIAEGRWEIDLENGIVTGKKGSNGRPNNYGYLVLGVTVNDVRYHFCVHEIIAVAGGLVPIDTTIDHINNDMLDNRLSNLQLLSSDDNNKKGWQNSPHRTQGINNGGCKLTEEQVAEIKMMLIDGKLTQRCIAWLYDVTQSTISEIRTGKRWSHVEVLDYV